MDPCILYAPLISVAVSLLKKIPFVNKNPKIVAAVLSLIAAVVGAGAGWKDHLQALVICVVVLLGGAVAFHEVVAKPAMNTLKPPTQ